MELSIREAKARFTKAAAAAARGERVVVTKHGRPLVELVPAQRASGVVTVPSSPRMPIKRRRSFAIAEMNLCRALPLG